MDSSRDYWILNIFYWLDLRFGFCFSKIQNCLAFIEATNLSSVFEFINVYCPNNDAAAFFETLFDFLGENDEEKYIIGGDFSTVLNSHSDKFGGT